MRQNGVSLGGLIFGGFFQIAMVITGSIPERIGMVFRIMSLTATGLFALSFVLFVGRWYIRKNRFF